MSIDIPVVSKFDPTGLKQAQNALGGFKKTLGTVAVALGAALSVRAVTDFAKSSINAASDLEESLNALSVSYGDASEGIAKLGEDAATRLGVTQSAFNAAAVRFSAFADRIVGEGGNVEGFVDDITTRAADFASVFNIDVAEALQVFQSGLSGEAEPLKRFGINLLQSEVQAYALEQGLIAVGEQMTEDIKTQARYGLLMQETAKTQGDFANTSDGLANSQRILQANFQDMQATVGGALLPAFASLSAGLLPVIEQMGPQLTSVAEELAPAIQNIANQIPFLLGGLMPLIPILGNVAAIFFQMVGQLLPIFSNLLNVLMQALEPLLPTITALAEQALGVLVDVFVSLIPLVVDLIYGVLPLLLDILVALAPSVLKIIEAFLPLIEMIIPILTDLLAFLIPVMTTVVEILAVLMVNAVNFLVEAFANFMEFLEPFTKMFEDTFGGISEFFYGIINGMIGMFEGFANSVISGVNAIIRAFNRLQIDVPATAFTDAFTIGFNIPELSNISLPRVPLAEGGIVTGPTSALIGEAGPEAVIPLGKMGSMGNTYNITINANVADARLGEVVVNAIKRFERTSGPVFASA